MIADKVDVDPARFNMTIREIGGNLF